MNITDVFFNNGQLNWNVISTVSNSILVAILIIITAWYAKQVKKQTEFMRKERLAKEMDKLVGQLYSQIGNDDIFLRGTPGHRRSRDVTHQKYFRFWDEIKQNKYLAISYLRSAIDNYLKNKSNIVGDITRDISYKKAEDDLFEEIKKRYSELGSELSV